MEINVFSLMIYILDSEFGYQVQNDEKYALVGRSIPLIKIRALILDEAADCVSVEMRNATVR